LSGYNTLEVTIKDRVATVTLNRPDKLNAITREMLNELVSAMENLDQNPEAYVIVLRGAGRAFTAGADLDWSTDLTDAERVDSNRYGQKAFARIEMVSKPVIAAIHGYALGGGLELALAADFIVCSSNAKFGLPEITLSAREPYRPKIVGEEGDPDQPEYGGQAPGWGGPKRLPERVGKAWAKQLMLTGVRIDAEQAVRIGLANEVYPEDEFEEKLGELTERMAAMNIYNLRLIKELVSHGYDMIEGHPQ
jgi:enoyl-CoA hydratase